jgi:hypothetical protein
MSITLMQLRTDLIKFGLNPADWRLKKVQRRRYKIANIKDRDFYFLGETKPGLMGQWSHIQLASF